MTAGRRPDAGEVRSTVEKIWCRHLLLDTAEHGVDFFAAGGDSLAAVAMLTDVVDELCPDADISELFLDEIRIDVVCRFVLDHVDGSARHA
jgi:hypothetical protein